MFTKSIKKFLSRDDILKIDDIKIEEVAVPEWGGVVFVKGMTGTERDQFEDTIIKYKVGSPKVITNFANVRATLASLTVCDAKGNRLFTRDDALALGEKSASALQKVFEVAQRLSGLTKEDVNQLTKDLEENPLDGSASDLPLPSDVPSPNSSTESLPVN